VSVTRRTLQYADLDAVIADAELLLTKGYDKTGNWDLAQCCLHLTQWLTFPIEGFPKPPLPIRMMLWMMKVTIGRPKLNKYLAEKAFPTGKPTIPETVYQTGGDPKEAVAKLNAAVRKFQAHKGDVHPSPLFGSMTKDECTRLQLVHCAHHLSFLVPKM